VSQTAPPLHAAALAGVLPAVQVRAGGRASGRASGRAEREKNKSSSCPATDANAKIGGKRLQQPPSPALASRPNLFLSTQCNLAGRRGGSGGLPPTARGSARS
jgi:hypothetical protein